MAGERENVAIFNPLTLPLPVWHPDGPDGTVDGYVIPFVFVEQRLTGPVENRRAQFRVYPTEFGWRAALRNCPDHAETAEQARAFAAGWIRAAELLEAEALRAAKEEALRRGPVDDDVVDAEVVDDEDDEDQGAELITTAPPCLSRSADGRYCIGYDNHEAALHVDEQGWSWHHTGERAYLAGDAEDGE